MAMTMGTGSTLYDSLPTYVCTYVHPVNTDWWIVSREGIVALDKGSRFATHSWQWPTTCSISRFMTVNHDQLEWKRVNEWLSKCEWPSYSGRVMPSQPGTFVCCCCSFFCHCPRRKWEGTKKVGGSSILLDRRLQSHVLCCCCWWWWILVTHLSNTLNMKLLFLPMVAGVYILTHMQSSNFGHMVGPQKCRNVGKERDEGERVKRRKAWVSQVSSICISQEEKRKDSVRFNDLVRAKKSGNPSSV